MTYNDLRKGRFSQSGVLYPVTTVTQHRVPYSAELEQGRKVVRELMALQAEGRAETLCYVVMPDHLHWLLVLLQGSDWIWCEHALTIGYRSSLTEIVQIIGRATRDAEGKQRASFTNLIAEPSAEQEEVAEAVNDMLKAIAARREERIIAGFEEILRFQQRHGRAPQPSEDRDIFERLYAVRLEQLRQLPEAKTLLAELDTPGLLRSTAKTLDIDALDDASLLAELAGEVEAEADDIRQLRHVRSFAEKRSAEALASHIACIGFDEQFEPLFKQMQRELEAGVRQSHRFEGNTRIDQGS